VPHEYWSDEQVGRCGRFVADPTPEELEKSFFLDEVAPKPKLRLVRRVGPRESGAYALLSGVSILAM
jgi:hypothetical protein